MHLPLRVMRTGVGYLSHDAQTRNISSRGVLFSSEADVPIGGSIEYVVTLSDLQGMQVDLRCFGKVVRLERPALQHAPEYLVAATLDRYEFVRREA
ncbi:MAG: hypothetical protein LAP39_28065 [Acidobacteriia bacterium]|nr:hypothetical protein [Terriglobia bacterium]